MVNPNQLLLSPLEKSLCSGRTKMDLIESIVSSFELSAVGAELKRSKARLPLLVNSEEGSDDNDTTLNDEDAWLSSPTQKKKLLRAPACSGAFQLFLCSTTSEKPLEMANDHLSRTSLRSFSVAQDVIPRIDLNELHTILTGAYVNKFDNVVVVDCRFPYEYEGGHIRNAINISLQAHLEEEFMLNPCAFSSVKTLLIFHCEYSLLRGPTMASHLRKIDRLRNADRYPHLTYPDIVVLEGGYKCFFDKYAILCVPQGYVEMKDTKHKRVCDIEMSKVLQASKLIRAKSFNVAKPCVPLAHTRSVSLTTILSSETQTSAGCVSSGPSNSPGPLGTFALHRSRSSKVHKRERRDSRPLFALSHCNLTQDSNEQAFSPLLLLETNDDFMPPASVIRDLSRTLPPIPVAALPLESVYSVTTYSSSDSLVDTPSPFTDTLDDFDYPPLLSKTTLTMGHTMPLVGTLLPRLSLARSSTRNYFLLLVSPTVSSPLFLSMRGVNVDSLSDDPF